MKKKSKKTSKKEIKKNDIENELNSINENSIKVKEVNEESSLWWIIGLICPIVGLFVYFRYKNTRQISSKALFGTILGTCIYLFIAFAILVSNNSTITIKEEDQTISNWEKDVLNDENVVTIMGLSTCSHCQEYKPVITKLSQKYHFKLYFFELDKLTDEEKEILMNKYDYEEYEGSVPYTFVINNNKLIAEKVGYKDRNDLVYFLKENKIIK